MRPKPFFLVPLIRVSQFRFESPPTPLSAVSLYICGRGCERMCAPSCICGVTLTSCTLPSSVFWMSAKWKRIGNKPAVESSLLIEVPLSPDAAQYALMSFNMSLSSRPSGLLIGSFSPLINSVRAGCAEPSWKKHSSIDPYLKQLTYPSVYMSMDIKGSKRGMCNTTSIIWVIKGSFSLKCLIFVFQSTQLKRFGVSVI